MDILYFFILLLSFLFFCYLSWQDIKTQQISRNLTILILLILVFYSLGNLFFFNYEKGFDSLLGGLTLGFFFLFCLIITKEKSIGLGDVYLIMVMGLLVGLQNIFFALSMVVFSALLFTIIRYRKIDLKQKIPLVPFITFGTFFVVIFEYFLK